jgi:CubicO group peptidase (beta-lactamase class C family)
MHLTRRITLAVMFAASASGLAADDPLPRATPQVAGLNSERLREVTELLNRYVAERKIAGAVAAVARRGRLAYLEAIGVQDVATRVPMTDRSLFRIYSMTKPVTSVAVMMLHERRRFMLDDPVSKYLPEFKETFVGEGSARRPPSREITVRDLLLHTSGLNHRTSDLYRNARVRSRSSTLPQFVRNIVRAPLMEDPGSRFRYSEGTTVLGRLVEIWSGQSFDAFLDEQLFRPLRMADTMFWVGKGDRARLTTVHGRGPAGGLASVEIEELPFTERPALIEGAVGLVSTVPDYLRFSQMLLNKGELDGVRILDATTVETMTSNGLPAEVQKTRGVAMGWGLANVNVVLEPAALSYPANAGEYGWDGSAGTIFWIDPAAGLVTILMTQSVPADPDLLRQRFKSLVQQAVND